MNQELFTRRRVRLLPMIGDENYEAGGAYAVFAAEVTAALSKAGILCDVEISGTSIVIGIGRAPDVAAANERLRAAGRKVGDER